MRQIYDASGAVVGSSRYDPFGNVMSQGGTATSVFAFAGEQQDATGLEYLRARYYSAAQGRFTTRDMWEGDPNSPMSYNAWLYAYANAVNLTDPSGRDVFIVPGYNDYGDYDDPKSWAKWLGAYVGHENYELWYEDWKKAQSPKDKIVPAQTYGIAIFNWGGALPNLYPTDSDLAAQNVQAQIDLYGLKDVTIVGHSKGASVLMDLLMRYKDGTTSKGQVKNVVIVDPPTLAGGVLQWCLGAPTSVDAQGTGVSVAVLPGFAACGPTPCSGPVENPTVPFPYKSTHEIRDEDADAVFSALGVQNDAHALRP